MNQKEKENLRKCVKCGSSVSQDATITMHRFPKPGRTNSYRCEAWAKYCFPNESWASPEFQRRLFTQHKMLCSKHFIKTCFVEQKLFRTAVPSEEFDEGDPDTPAEEHSSFQGDPDTPAEEHSSQMSPDVPAEEVSSEIVPDPLEELKVCRICLALDVKMYNMEDWKLTEMFQNITGIQVSADSHSILQRLCWECAARLTAAAAFRDKALLSDGLLQILLQAGDDVTKSDIISMKENHTSLKTALTIQKVFYTTDEKENEQDTPTDNFEIDNTLLNNEIKTYSRINVARDNRTHCPTFIREVREEGAGVTDKIDTEMLEKHLIVIPTNIDSDPMDDITNKNRACPLLEFVNFVKNPIVVNEVEVDSTEATPTDNTIRSDTNKEINETTRVAVINEDGNIVLIDKKVKKHKIDEIDDTVSCEDDTLQPKAKKFLIKTVDIKPMKVKPGIKRKNNRRCTTAEQDKSIVDRVREEQTLHTPSLAKEFGVSPSILRARLRDAGFKPLYRTAKNTPRILKKKQKVKIDKGTKQIDEGTKQVDEGTKQIDEGTKQVDEGTKQVDEGTKQIDEGTKQQVMSSEQDGESVSEIARRLDTSSR